VFLIGSHLNEHNEVVKMPKEIVKLLRLDEIDIPKGRREIDKAKVDDLAKSIEQIGLQHPITVRQKGCRYELVAGWHRLEAVRKLGREAILARITLMPPTEAKMWEISENLHRSELTVQERADHIEQWRKLCEEKKGAQVGHPGGKQPHDAGVSEVSRELGVPRQEVERARKIASISPEAREAVKEAGLDDNQSALLEVAKEPPEQQAARVAELKQKRASARRSAKLKVKAGKAENETANSRPKSLSELQAETRVLKGELPKFVEGYERRVGNLLAENTRLDKRERGDLKRCLYQCADRLNQLADRIDGGADPIPEDPCADSEDDPSSSLH
jgi:ParB family chromosome partitioning protein